MVADLDRRMTEIKAAAEEVEALIAKQRALGLCIVVGARIAPVAWRVIRFDQDRERDMLMVSWGLMWAAVVPLLTLRVYRIFVNNHQLYQDWWGMDVLIGLVAVSAALMLVVDASIRRRE